MAASLTIVWGVPGVGKSTFARWLASNKGYTHIETDAGGPTAVDRAWQRTLPGHLIPEAFMQVVAKHGHPVVLEYGAYVAPGAVALLRKLQELGADPWWFDGNRLAAFAAWRAENRAKPRDFEDEKWHEVVSVINAHWQMIEQFFGRERILRTIDAGPTHVPPETIYATMRRVAGYCASPTPRCHGRLALPASVSPWISVEDCELPDGSTTQRRSAT